MLKSKREVSGVSRCQLCAPAANWSAPQNVTCWTLEG